MDGTIRLWDVKAGKQFECLKFSEYGAGKVAISTNNKFVLGIGRYLIQNKIFCVWDLKTGKQLYKFIFGERVLDMFFLSDDYRVIVNTEQYCLLLDLKRGKFNKLPINSLYRTAFLINSNLAIRQSDDEFRLVDMKTSKELRTFKTYTYQLGKFLRMFDFSLSL